MLEIVILAMVAAFLGLRLYSVLGERAEHEEESTPLRFDTGEQDKDKLPPAAPRPGTPVQPAAPAVQLEGVMPAVERGVRAIASADPQFDITAFLEGAKGAYAMVLEAFWTGDKETLKELCDDDVYASFSAAIDTAPSKYLTIIVQQKDANTRSIRTIVIGYGGHMRKFIHGLVLSLVKMATP